jgi:hypothetical protein
MAATETFHRRFEAGSPTRQRVMGIIFLVAALGIIFFFATDVEGDEITRFGLSRGGAATQLSRLIYRRKAHSTYWPLYQQFWAAFNCRAVSSSTPTWCWPLWWASLSSASWCGPLPEDR